MILCITSLRTPSKELLPYQVRVCGDFYQLAMLGIHIPFVYGIFFWIGLFIAVAIMQVAWYDTINIFY